MGATGLVKINNNQTGNLEVFGVRNIRKIMENRVAGSGIIAQLASTKTSVTSADTIANIYDQQAVSSKSLGFIRVTDESTNFNAAVNLDTLFPTWRIKDITAEGSKSKINFHNYNTTVIASESLATIYAQQTGPGVKLGMVLVTRSSDSKQFIIFEDDIERILETGSGSTIWFYDARADMVVDETPNTIWTAQP
jgi:predicted metallo-beta-lactamase superfamily hydrolase